MYLCYIDESGTPDIPGNTSHFVLVGIAIPIESWKDYERDVAAVKRRYGLEDKEIHTGWILRAYREQAKIPDFEKLDKAARISAVRRERHVELLALQKASNHSLYKQTRKNFLKTDPYIHLTRAEREQFIQEIAEVVSSWGRARLFAECIDKLYFDPSKARLDIGEQALEQIVSRFEQFLTNVSRQKNPEYGLLIHDNNDTVARRHTEMMRRFHAAGTFWVRIKHIMETPLFVDSELTGMIQIADVCAFAMRRYLENGETKLFEPIFRRGDRTPKGACVGIRHYTKASCDCEICVAHRIGEGNHDQACT